MRKSIFVLLCVLSIFILLGCSDRTYIKIDNDSFEFEGNQYYPLETFYDYSFDLDADYLIVGWTKTMFWNRVPLYRSALDFDTNVIFIDGMTPDIWVKSGFQLPEITDCRIKKIVAWKVDVQPIAFTEQLVWEAQTEYPVIGFFLDDSTIIDQEEGDIYLRISIYLESIPSLIYSGLSVVEYDNQLYLRGVEDHAVLIDSTNAPLFFSAYAALYENNGIS